MKLTTTLIETLAYVAQVAAIIFVFIGITSAEPVKAVIIGLVLWTIGFALYRWELVMESKRKEAVNHIDYIILMALGWLMLLIPLIALFTPSLKSEIAHLMVSLLVGAHLISTGIIRRAMYKKLDNKEDSK